MNSIFSISNEDINRLSTEDCVKLFGDLLHADAKKIRLPISKVSFTSKTVPDGGIDASVEDGIQRQGDLVIDSESFYQIKSGTTFAPWNESEARSELLGRKEARRGNLGSQVQRCLERNGTYILVCMKLQMTAKNRTDAVKNLKKILQECGISDPKVAVFDQEHIIGIAKSYPSLALRLTNRGGSIFESHREWGIRDDMQDKMVMGSEQKQFISRVRDMLLDDSGAVHLNVYGETGVGKTRLILEATRDPFLSGLVVYCPSPRNCMDGQLLVELVRNDSLHCILVVDDCDHDERVEIWRRLKNLGRRIKLVTIHSDFYPTTGTTEQIQAPNLDDHHTQQIILTYQPNKTVASRLGSLCGGIPRVAHIVGWDLRNDPSQLLGSSPDTYDVWNRYVNYGEDPKSEHARQRRKILLTMSLFKRFGNMRHFRDEFNAVHCLVHRIDSGISPSIFVEHVRELQRRKTLQGEDVLYISPKALHLWLWMNWWENYGDLFNMAEMVQELPEQLEGWFFAMFEYAGSGAAKHIVKRLFEDGGPLYDSDAIRTRLGPEFFKSLSFVDPHAAARHLGRMLGSWTDEELKNFHGRRKVLDGLERIVFEPDLFLQGGRMLRDLARCENEYGSNGATGLFAGLFSLGTGYESATSTPPEERIPLLKETICDASAETRELGFKACEAALCTAGSERGVKPWRNQKGWEPKTDEELVAAHQAVMHTMAGKIPELPQKEQRRCAEIIFKNARGIMLRNAPKSGTYIVKRLQELEKFVAKETVLRQIIPILEFDSGRLEPEAKDMLEDIRRGINGHDYPSRMRRYAGMDMMVDLAASNGRQERREEIRRLAMESLEIEKLKPELGWLVTPDAKSGDQFGYELAALDKNQVLLGAILDSQRNAGEDGSAVFLGGYMQGIFKTDRNRWTKIMESISKDRALLRFFLEIAWRSGMTDRIGQVLLEMVKNGEIDAGKLYQFCIGGTVRHLSEPMAKSWIRTMLAYGSPDVISGAADLFYMYFINRQERSLDMELTLELLMHRVFFDRENTFASNMAVDHRWKETAMRFIQQHPGKSLVIAEKFLESMGHDSPVANPRSQSIKVLDTVAARHPNETWNIVTQFIDPPTDERGHAIINWAGRTRDPGPGLMQQVDLGNVLDWIDHEPHSRAPFIARYLPPNLTGQGCLARKILARYGSDDSVQESMLANFTDRFSDMTLEHCQDIKDEIQRYKKTEDNENVRAWIDMYVDSLDACMQREESNREAARGQVTAET